MAHPPSFKMFCSLTEQPPKLKLEWFVDGTVQISEGKEGTWQFPCVLATCYISPHMHFPPNQWMLQDISLESSSYHSLLWCLCLYAKSSALVTPKDQSTGTGVWHFDFGLTNHREFFRRWPAPSDLLFPRYRAGCISHHSSVGKAKFSQLFKLWKATLRARCCSTFHPHRIKQMQSMELPVTTTPATISLSPQDTRDTDV